MNKFLQLEHVARSYQDGVSLGSGRQIWPLKDVSFCVHEGERVGLIGQSGAGKSTLARIVLGLEKPSRGRILMQGRPFDAWRRENPSAMSVVFQNYYESVNPMWTVQAIVSEPLALLGQRDDGRVAQLLSSVGLSGDFAGRYPHQLSGGQMQRVCIARALIADPKFVIFDEAVSSLDVSVQAEILELLRELSSRGLAWLFISHDLQAVTSVCSRVMFLSEGAIVEDLSVQDLAGAKSDCARELLGAVMPFQSGFIDSGSVS